MIRLLRSIIGLVLALPEGGEVVPRDSLQAHHPTQKPPGPYPRQEGSSVTVPKSLPRLFGYSFARSREAKALLEKLGELELSKSCSLSRPRVSSVMIGKESQTRQEKACCSSSS